MGGGSGPKSVGGSSDGGTGTVDGLDAIAQYGRGERDPETGLFDYYELPDDHEAHGGQGSEVRLLDAIEQWPLLVADFVDRGIRIHKERDSLTWAEFRDVLVGLLMDPNSRLWRHFSRDSDAPEDDDD